MAVERLQRVASDARTERRRLLELLERMSQARDRDAKDEESLLAQLSSWEAAAGDAKTRVGRSRQAADSLVSHLNSKVMLPLYPMYS